MKATKYNLEFRAMGKHYYEDTKPLKIELESYVREIDQSIGQVVNASEVLANYKTYEKLRQAACLIRDAMNELYEENKKAGGQ